MAPEAAPLIRLAKKAPPVLSAKTTLCPAPSTIPPMVSLRVLP